MSRYTDALTGLPTRPALDEPLQTGCVREDGVALALLDVDHFVEVNEQATVAGGDRLLQTIASILSEAFPGTAYRVSGDEFAVILPGQTLEQAFLKMDRVRAAVGESQDRFNLPVPVTITIGVAHCPRDAKDPAGLMRAASSALMAAKESGRNQVALPPNEEMVMKSSYYAATSVRKLKALAERTGQKESRLLREALDDVLRKYDQP